MKTKQFCSVCKEWLEMEVVPTGDGDDDGVIWYRCPQCQGFLPKLSSAETGDTGQENESVAGDDQSPAAAAAAPAGDDDDLPFDSPAEMMAAQQAAATDPDPDLLADVMTGDLPDLLDPTAIVEGAGPLVEDEVDEADEDESGDRPEPVAEYAAMLAEALNEMPPDQVGGSPYRPWETYAVGQCVQHLAWEDCGIVVGKEQLPGGRQVIKVFFQAAGVVRLIEQAAQ